MQIDKLRDLLCGQTQGRELAASVDDVASVLWIKVLHDVYVDVENLCNLFKVNVAVNHHRVGLCRQLGNHRADVVVAVIVHYVVGGNECRHIASCLLRQIGVDVPIVGQALCAVYGFVDALRPAVVSRDDEVPVAENLVQVAQIVGSGIRCFDRVATFVDERVDLKAILLACVQHKLPKACCSHTRHGVGVESRLDDGQIFKLQGQTIAFERFLENGHVEVLCAEHEAHGAAQVSAVTVYQLLHHFVIRHLHDRRYAAEALFVHLFLIHGVDVGLVAVDIALEISLRVVHTQEAVILERQGLGQINYFLFSFLVCHSDLCVVVIHVLCLDAAVKRKKHCDYQ